MKAKKALNKRVARKKGLRVSSFEITQDSMGASKRKYGSGLGK